MARGNHIFVWRQAQGVPYQHHAVDLGDGTVIHFTDGDGQIAAPSLATSSFEIRRTEIGVLTRSGRDRVQTVRHRKPLPACVVVSRALSQVGRGKYHLLYDNCEHFACWCVVGRTESRQVSTACERLGSVGAKVVAAGTVRVASKTVIRGASPWLLASDAAQWVTEAVGHHVGLSDPQHRRTAGRAVGITTALGVGAAGGPGGMLIAGGLWAVGELAAQVSQVGYQQRCRAANHPVSET